MVEKEKLISLREELQSRGRELVIASPQLFIDVDIEADGIAGYGSILSIGAVTPQGETFYSEVRPESVEYIVSHLKFCEQHGLGRERLFRQAPSYLIVMREFHKWVTAQSLQASKEPILCGFNASYDFSFIDLYFRRSGIENPFHFAPLDLKSLAIFLSQNWDWNSTSKSRLPDFVLPEGDFTHHALEDAKYQQKIHFALAGLKQEYLSAS